jgi:predicted nucleotidyltransferase
MNRLDAIRQLTNRGDALKERGATSLFVFGSTARDQTRADSDLDLFIDYDPQRKFSLVDLSALKNFLEDELGLTVDLTTRDGLHPALRAEIERSAERVF